MSYNNQVEDENGNTTPLVNPSAPHSHVENSEDHGNTLKGVKKEEVAPAPTKYAWVVLFIIVFMSICNQW